MKRSIFEELIPGMMDRQVVFFMLILMLTGCLKTQPGGENESFDRESEHPDQVISLLGTALPPKELPESVNKRREEQLATARAEYERNPRNEENIIWYGRRLGYLGRYSEAIRIYSIGLDLYPNSYRLLRHRGHRYITIRKFNEAIEDLQQAAFYSRPASNAVEPDGLPNRLNKPLTNDKFNIWYHLGIAYYLKGNYDKAISSFKKCMGFCDNDDLMVAATDWFYMTYRKTGNVNAATELLTGISRRMTIIENHAYYQRLLMYKEIYPPETLIDKAERENDSLDPTLGYGVANFYLYSGQVDKARVLYEKVLLNPQWDALGYIASEVDVISLTHL